MAAVAVVHLMHIGEGVEVADEVDGAERLAGFHRPAAELLDQDDDVPEPLAAAGFVDHHLSAWNT